MRTASKVDANQRQIVSTFRQAGASVEILSGVGRGCPDLAVGYHGQDVFVEVKDKRGTLTPDQIVWHKAWRGRPVAIVRSSMDAVKLLNEMTT
jgi:Holliday junction resolvase